MVQTAGQAVTYPIVGTCEPGDFVVRQYNKTSPAATAGKVFALTNTVTPNSFQQAVATDVRPFIVVSQQQGIGSSGALNSPTVLAFAEGQVYVLAGGAIQPGAYVQPDASGNVVTQSGGTDNKVGKYLHLPGDDGASSQKKACASGDIILIDLNEV